MKKIYNLLSAILFIASMMITIFLQGGIPYKGTSGSCITITDDNKGWSRSIY